MNQFEIYKSDRFAEWLDGLGDLEARARIQARTERLAMGNAGDFGSVGAGVLEMRVDCGPGYRVYYTIRRPGLVLLLAGGSKRSQARDFEFAIRLVRALSE